MPSKDRITKPIVNVMTDKDQERWNWAMSLISMEHADLVAAHKKLFGQQSYCWNGIESRHWVWELGGCRVYVSNWKGISFEVESDHNREKAIESWEEYLSRWKCLELDEGDETLEEKAIRLVEETNNQ